MSINMDPERTSEVDYSDFEYQTIAATTQQDDSGNGTQIIEADPLEQQGGLRPNQIAELVYLELIVSNSLESTSGVVDTIETRGAVGSNFDASEDDPSIDSFGTNIDPDVVSGSFVGTGASTKNDPAVFQLYHNNGYDVFHSTKNFRQLTGRGPVLDANDDLSIISTVTNETTENVDSSINVHAVYDLFEMDDARTEFSVPM